jgi:hypothetical protein
MLHQTKVDDQFFPELVYLLNAFVVKKRFSSHNIIMEQLHIN